MDKVQTPAQRRAGRLFREQGKASEAQSAWKDYQAEQEATRRKTARLRAERLAREALAPAEPAEKSPVRKARAGSVRTARRG